MAGEPFVGDVDQSVVGGESGREFFLGMAMGEVKGEGCAQEGEGEWLRGYAVTVYTAPPWYHLWWVRVWLLMFFFFCIGR